MIRCQGRLAPSKKRPHVSGGAAHVGYFRSLLGAAVLEPTKLEDWARRTPFGNGPDDKKFKTQGEQQKALHEALGLVVQPDAQEPQSA